MTRFQDHFSGQANEYARFRPQYPESLFFYLASVAPALDLAWDCGTGSGQAAQGLVRHFRRVVATDASADQVARAFRHERIEYRVEPAEQPSLADRSVDLITVAIALHWFDFDSFYRTVRRVAVPGGILAAWTYHLPDISPEIDAILRRYHGEFLTGYWPERIHYVDDRYRSLPFPFTELSPPPFAMESRWTLAHLLGFLDSWSATQRYRQQHGPEATESIWKDLTIAWGQSEQARLLRWPLHLRVGRVEPGTMEDPKGSAAAKAGP